MAYLNWDTKIVQNPSSDEITNLYDQGYLLTRVEKGLMNKSRSFRINLEAYVASSENRRILRKAEHMKLSAHRLPYAAYDWSIGKLAKDFYEGIGATFSANKVKEMLTDADNSNFTTLLVFNDSRTEKPVGYVICYEARDFIHYSYPFYVEDPNEPSRGLVMMTMAVEWAKTSGKKYVYLGALQRPSDVYKLQFRGGEWFDGEIWQVDTEPLKEILKQP